jgi:ArsR family metal-binding transcriptional regulator
MAPCVISDKNVRFEAELSRSIKEVMPYLNAIIKNASYNPETDTIFFTRGIRMITLTDKRLAVSRAIDQTDAFKIMDFIKNNVNEAYDNRDNITPVYEKKIRATALDIFSYLPKTNCKDCGEPNCLAFAVKLLLGEQILSACTPLMDDGKFKEHKKEMESLVEAMGLKK